MRNVTLQSFTLSFYTPCPFNLNSTSSLISDSHRRHSNWTVSFPASFASSLSLSLHHSLTNLSCHDSHLLHHLSVSLHLHHLPSHHQNTLAHSTTPSNTLLTLRHPHSHQADHTNHPTSYSLHYQSLSIQLHHFTSKQQTCKLQHPLHFLPLHLAITASPLHDHRFKSTAPMLHTKRFLKNPWHTPYQFTPLQSQHPLYQPHPFHFHINKHSRQWWKR